MNHGWLGYRAPTDWADSCEWTTGEHHDESASCWVTREVGRGRGSTL